MLKVRFDSKAVLKRAKQRRAGYQKAHIQALNRTATGVRTDAARQVKGQVNVKVGVIRKEMDIERANKHKPRAKIITRGPAYADLGARQTKKGVTFKIKRDGSRKLLRSAFIARMPRANPNREGHLGVFRRTGRLTRNGRRQIKEVYTTNFVEALRGPAVHRANVQSARTRYAKAYQDALRFQMSRLR